MFSEKFLEQLFHRIPLAGCFTLQIVFTALFFFSFLNVLLFWEEATEKYKRSGVTKYSFKVETKRSLGKKDFLVTL